MRTIQRPDRTLRALSMHRTHNKRDISNSPYSVNISEHWLNVSYATNECELLFSVDCKQFQLQFTGYSKPWAPLEWNRHVHFTFHWLFGMYPKAHAEIHTVHAFKYNSFASTGDRTSHIVSWMNWIHSTEGNWAELGFPLKLSVI